MVKVAWAANEPEAELLQGLLRQAGIPSVLRRQLGFDLPDYLAAGGRDVLVPARAEAAARQALAEVAPEPEAGVPVEPSGPPTRPLWVRLVGAVLALGLLLSALAATITGLLGWL